MMSIFLQRSIPELIEDIRGGRLSYGDLAETTARVVAEHESATLAWVDFDSASLKAESQRAARAREVRGYSLDLDGMPFGVKDVFNTIAFPTQMGSALWKGFTPGNNARVVDSLILGGAVPAGKTVTAEFAVHALNETLNPHDASRTPGTSSSGSAAAVAVGMVPFALGTQTAGSIVRPASFCGVWGMKPSFGLTPRTGVLKTTDSLDTIGFVAAHARSLRPILDHMRVKGPDYPFVYRGVDQRGPYPHKKHSPWKIGVVKTHTWNCADSDVKMAVTELADRIAGLGGCEVAEMAWPAELERSHEIHSTIYTKSLAYYFQQEAKSSSDLSPIMNAMIEAGRVISPKQFRQALRDQESVARQLDQELAGFDLVLSVGTSTDAPPRGQDEEPDPSLIWTLCHVPAVAVPAFRSRNGLPFGVQFIARRWNDYLLLQGIESLVERGVVPAGSQPIR